MRGRTQLKKALLGAKHVTPDCEVDHIPHAQCPYTLSDYVTDSLPVHSLSQTHTNTAGKAYFMMKATCCRW